jgi:hypothetical protein
MRVQHTFFSFSTYDIDATCNFFNLLLIGQKSIDFLFSYFRIIDENKKREPCVLFPPISFTLDF